MPVTGPTNNEQYMLELINDTRLDPQRNADRYISNYPTLTSGDSTIQAAFTLYSVYGPSLQTAFQALTPVGALAWNNALATSAETHSAAMISAQTESTQVSGEATLASRISTAGYSSATSVAENVSAYAGTVLSGHAGMMVEWGVGPDGMLQTPIHRTNLMSGTFNEIGIDITAETTTSNPLGPQVVTQDFATRGKHFVLGVAYNDSDSNNFYTPGEGLATLVVKEGSSNQVTTGTAGGYSLEVTTGAKTMTLTGGGLASAVTVSVTIGATDNLKLDVVDGHILRTSGSVTVSGSPIDKVIALDARGQSLTTGTGAQTLIGTRGADTLNGGAGADRMEGGAGADVYHVDDAGDTVVETTGNGTDTVNSSVTYTLANYLEKLILTGSTAIDGTGNAQANTITGNSGANTLNGGDGADTMSGGDGVDALNGGGGGDTLNGGAGNDTLNGGAAYDKMFGGAGNDIYYVDGTGDKVYETTTSSSSIDTGGTDEVYSSVSFNLAAYNGVKFVEKLTLTGTGNTNGTGNDLANTITGNNKINTLGGGNGNDTLYGGEGADTLNGGAGTDTLYGDAGNDTLNGGQGSDTMTGAAGADRFDFRATLGATNIDTISEFVTAEDFIRLDDAMFTGIGALGALSAAAFNTGALGVASDASDRIIHDATTGYLYFDADGSADVSAPIHFATITTLTGTLGANDFVIV